MTRRDAIANRERILAAAREVFVERGPNAPLDEIARRAGTGIATLYRHFPDRSALARAVVEAAVLAATAAVRAAVAAEPDPFAALRRYVHEALDLGVAAVIPTLLDSVPQTDPALTAEGGALLDGLVRSAQSAGLLRPDVTVGDLGTLVVRLSRPLPGGLPAGVEAALAHRHADVVLDGLRSAAVTTVLPGPALSFDALRAESAGTG
ncbi:helix-turn-helix domain-containing protein [Asanoa sp. NPDC049573]|uniref:TetR/AcrR family transcriptional regulator n=1 Tax=Asanoa sp. NPDC049573 TaxID=3155396 RepID=UPI003431F239